MSQKEGPALIEWVWVRPAPKQRAEVIAGLSFAHGAQVLKTEATPEVKEAIRRGRLQTIMSKTRPVGVEA